MPATLSPVSVSRLPGGVAIATIPGRLAPRVVASAIAEDGQYTCEFRPGYKRYLAYLLAILRDRQ